jgi:hypothetical protein
LKDYKNYSKKILMANQCSLMPMHPDVEKEGFKTLHHMKLTKKSPVSKEDSHKRREKLSEAANLASPSPKRQLGPLSPRGMVQQALMH